MADLPSAGTILAAAEALRTRRGGSWTDAELSVLLRTAYDAGRGDRCRDEWTETHACWLEHPISRSSREELVARRIAAYPQPRPLVLDDPLWPPVRVPGAVEVSG